MGEADRYVCGLAWRLTNDEPRTLAGLRYSDRELGSLLNVLTGLPSRVLNGRLYELQTGSHSSGNKCPIIVTILLGE